MSRTIKILTVTDLHRLRGLYFELAQVATHEKPDVLCLVGDFLDFCGTTEPQITTGEAALSIARMEVPEIIFVRGNHEDFAWFEFQDAWATTGRRLVALHGEAFTVGPATIIGFPCLMGDETAFVGERPPLPANPNPWLSRLLERYGQSIRTLWLMHEPLTGTPLSQPDSPVAGNPKWRGAIERFRPIITISGHDHLTPIRNGKWHHRIGSTTCVNVGQIERGPLHYCVVEAEFPGDVPGLPTRMPAPPHIAREVESRPQVARHNGSSDPPEVYPRGSLDRSEVRRD